MPKNPGLAKEDPSDEELLTCAMEIEELFLQGDYIALQSVGEHKILTELLQTLKADGRRFKRGIHICDNAPFDIPVPKQEPTPLQLLNNILIQLQQMVTNNRETLRFAPAINITAANESLLEALNFVDLNLKNLPARISKEIQTKIREIRSEVQNLLVSNSLEGALITMHRLAGNQRQ